MVVEISGLSKVYSSGQAGVTAVDGIDLSVGQGEIFGLLGPNGAGKTTTISICTTRALPTGGGVVIAGIDVVRQPARARAHLGVVPQYNTLDRSLTIFENLYYHCRYFGFARVRAKARSRELLSQFLLLEREGAYPSELSGGLQQRVQIARAIAHRPSVLFLDEPSAGLDPQSRIAMWDAVRGLRAEGITVVLTTHYMEEADSLCDRVAVVDKGKVLALDTPAQLKQTLGAGTVIELRLRDMDSIGQLLPLLEALEEVEMAERSALGVRLFARKTEGLLARVVLAAEPFGVRDLSIQEPSLETVFIRLTGRELRD
jgi:ABC-2 type transport system ATP-binding protein